LIDGPDCGKVWQVEQLDGIVSVETLPSMT